MRITLIQLRSFEARWRDERLLDEELQVLESEILENPDVGDVMRGTGGLRKMRFAPRSRGKGKSGAFRVCYAHFPEYGRVYLVILFPKNQQSNLSAAQRIAIKTILDRISKALRQGENP